MCLYFLRIALLQLATRSAVYLLDMIALTAKVSEEVLCDFIASVFSFADTIKLGQCQCDVYYDVVCGDIAGYGIAGNCWPFVAEIVGTPGQVIDLQVFAHSVSIQLTFQSLLTFQLIQVNVAANPKSEAHKNDKSLTHKTTSPIDTQEELTIPSQCSSLNEAIVMRTFKKLDSIPDETEFPSVPVSGDDIVGDKEDNTTEETTSSGPRGLGLLVKECFGKPLDKSQQLSDWE